MTRNPRTTSRARRALDRWVKQAPSDREWGHVPGTATANDGFIFMNWKITWVRPTIIGLADVVVPGWDKAPDPARLTP